jgi:hypothetical protein
MLAREALFEAAGATFAAEAATRGGPITLPGSFSGWSAPATLRELVAGRVDPAFRTPLRLYRIYRTRAQRPLYIGAAFGRMSSVHQRVSAHYRGTGIGVRDPRRSERYRLYLELRRHPDDIRVQHGAVTGTGRYPLDAKLLRAYEAALQVFERPRTALSGIHTFEELDHAEPS